MSHCIPVDRDGVFNHWCNGNSFLHNSTISTQRVVFIWRGDRSLVRTASKHFEQFNLRLE